VLREDHKGAIWVGTDDGLYRLEQRDGHASLRFIDLSMPHAFPSNAS
jgi:ligand-binding sensor domain-containing protein